MFSGRKKWNEQPGLVEIYVTSGLLQAEIIKGKLESNGIPVLLQYESLGPVMGLTLNGLGQVRLLVREEQVESARAVLEETAEEADDESLSP
jgi:hypothetical protein